MFCICTELNLGHGRTILLSGLSVWQGDGRRGTHTWVMCGRYLGVLSSRTVWYIYVHMSNDINTCCVRHRTVISTSLAEVAEVNRFFLWRSERVIILTALSTGGLKISTSSRSLGPKTLCSVIAQLWPPAQVPDAGCQSLMATIPNTCGHQTFQR